MRPETIIYTTTANAIITVNTFCVAASGISTIRTVNPGLAQMRLSCAQNKLTLHSQMKRYLFVFLHDQMFSLSEPYLV